MKRPHFNSWERFLMKDGVPSIKGEFLVLKFELLKMLRSLKRIFL